MKKDPLGFIREETRKRCSIIDLTTEIQRQFQIVSLELFHYLYEIFSIDFALYFKVENSLIEFIKPEEFSKELLDQMWQAAHKPRNGIEIMIKRADYPKYEIVIESIRKKKIAELLQMDPHLDRKVIDAFTNLSGASQMITRGGLNSGVTSRVKSSATYLINNIVRSEEAISTLSKMVIHDPTLYDHSAAVAMISGVIGSQCLKKPLSPKENELLAQCGLYHDIGKTCVPSAILNKPGKFTDDEFEIMKSHAAKGEEELELAIGNGAHIDHVCARVAGEHHERFTGKGYPRGRKGRFEEDPTNGIHIYSRIVTIADVYSALLMKRVYKPSYEAQDAIKIMADIAVNEYDPNIFYPFLKNVINSLNQYQEKHKSGGKGRILSLGDDGKLMEEKKVG
jgi:HD-GYP domain-containing protein (c-di-GMP phosphodiesterase class II)